jgi:hypothetical protein
MTGGLLFYSGRTLWKDPGVEKGEGDLNCKFVLSDRTSGK